MAMRTTIVGAGLLALALVVGACSQPLSTREKSAVGGGLLGAATGAIIGAATGSPAAGAAIGGGLGTLGGALVGDQIQKGEVRQSEQQRQLEEQRREVEQQRRELEELKRRESSEESEEEDWN